MRCRQLILFFLMLMIVSGCVRQGLDTSGKTIAKRSLGEVPAAKSLDLIGKTTQSSIRAYALADGSVNIVAGDGSMEVVSVRVKDRNELLKILNKAEEWGEVALREKVDVGKNMGNLMEEGMAWFSAIYFQFNSVNGGQDWYLLMHFAYYNAWASGPGVSSSNPKYQRDVNLFVPGSSIKKLAEIVNNTEAVLQKAQEDEKKGELFK